jgi:hypothetical protein
LARTWYALLVTKTLKTAIFAAATMAASWVNLISATAATKRDDGDEPGTLMSAGDAALIFGGIPLAVLVLLVVLIWAPSRGRNKSTELSNY